MFISKLYSLRTSLIMPKINYAKPVTIQYLPAAVRERIVTVVSGVLKVYELCNKAAVHKIALNSDVTIYEALRQESPS